MSDTVEKRVTKNLLCESCWSSLINPGKQNLHEDVLKTSWRGVDLEDFFSLKMGVFFSLKRGDLYLFII